MKRLYIALYCAALTTGNCLAAIILGRMAGHMREAYRGLLGVECVLSGITKLAMTTPLWFWILGALSLLSGLALFVRRLPVLPLVYCLLVFALLDCIALFCFSLGLWDHIYGGYEWVGGE